MNEKQISDKITVEAQPLEDELNQLKTKGYKSIVNLRTAGEDDQPLSPENEGEKVKTLGMKYLHIPVSSQTIRPEQVDQFREEFKQLSAPIFIHCYKGKRAGAFAMMQVAIDEGWSGEETLQKANEMGFQCDVPELAEFVKKYVDSNRQ